MKFTKFLVIAVALLALLVVPMGMTAKPAAAQGGSFETAYRCFPTCSETDGRFVSIAGADLTTLTEPVAFKIIAAAGTAPFEIGFFDGDSVGYPSGTWDYGVNEPLEFTLYADPAGDGTGTFVVSPFPMFGSAMTDNAWYTVNVNNDPQAASLSGDFIYRLKANLPDPSKQTWNNFKVRTDALLLVPPHTFAFTAPLFSPNEGYIIYPNARSGDLSTTTYGGTWYWYLDVPGGIDHLTVWDGDFDRGSWNNTDLDTDDPDTPNAPFIPWFAGTTARPEGVATVQLEDGCKTQKSSTACPADDRSPGIDVRSPSIRYTVITPDKQTFLNNNPSGNKEWEQFRIDTALPFDPDVMDYHADSLPAGTYIIRTDGVDLNNLNTWYFEYNLHGVPSASIGDRVWYDINGDGVQDVGEPGLNGVVVSLYRDNGDGVFDANTDTLLGSQTTSGDGGYDFLGLGAGNYWVDVDESTLPAGVTWMRTTANPYTSSGPYSLAESADHNDADFGYNLAGGASGGVGDFVWWDLDGDGIQDDSEPGIEGVKLTLLADVNNDGVVEFTLTKTTLFDGSYAFGNLPVGEMSKYTVVVDDGNFLPGGALHGFGATVSLQGDPAEDSNGSPTFTILNQTKDTDLTLDFGYVRASIGDFVWEDQDADGIQDAGESGIARVTVNLYDGDSNLVNTTTTDENGYYRFTDLMPGDYYVEFVAPTGYFFSPQDQGGDDTKDSDANTTTGQTGTITLVSGQNDMTWDAGLYRPATLGDYVWMDSNRNGVQEPVLGEIGIAGVTVKLYDSSNQLKGTTTTNANGFYYFTGLMPGSYIVQFVKPAGYSFSPQDQGTNDTLDSDANPTTGMTAAITLVSGQRDLRWDAGLYLMTSPGTGTPGYWMNHPEAWPVDSITIGGRTYSRNEAINYMRNPTAGDVTYTMFQALVAAKLNVGIGNLSSCIADTILAADAWMAQYPVGSGVKAGGKNSPWRTGEPLYLKLDDYNNGRLCAPHRD